MAVMVTTPRIVHGTSGQVSAIPPTNNRRNVPNEIAVLMINAPTQ